MELERECKLGVHRIALVIDAVRITDSHGSTSFSCSVGAFAVTIAHVVLHC